MPADVSELIATAMNRFVQLMTLVEAEDWEEAEKVVAGLDRELAALEHALNLDPRAGDVHSMTLIQLAQRREAVLQQLSSRRDSTLDALTRFNRKQRASSAYQRIDDQSS